MFELGRKISIIPMELKHLDEVYELEINSFSIPWTKESLRKEIEENKLAIYYVAANCEEDGNEKIVGYAGMWHVVTEGHITNIVVGEEYRCRGIGNKLISKLIEIGKEKEMIGLTLEVRVGNKEAMLLYSKNGFVVEGYRKNYYADTKEDALIMWKDL